MPIDRDVEIGLLATSLALGVLTEIFSTLAFLHVLRNRRKFHPNHKYVEANNTGRHLECTIAVPLDTTSSPAASARPLAPWAPPYVAS